MNADEFDARLLEIRKQYALEAVANVCAKEGLPEPVVNFEGCPNETEFQLAHYHPDLNRICISVIQLYKLKTREAIRDTMFHELAHMVAQDHGGTFMQAKDRFYRSGWRPPPGVIFHGADYYARKDAEDRAAEAAQRVPEGQKKYEIPSRGEATITSTAEVKTTPLKNKAKRRARSRNKTSFSKKSSKSRRKTGKKISASPKQSIHHISDEKYKKMEESYGMTKTEMEESRRKLGLVVDKNRQLQEEIEKEHEELTRKVYGNMDTGFGDKHGENRWNRRKGILGKLRKILGI